jgi:hypothetical protein
LPTDADSRDHPVGGDRLGLAALLVLDGGGDEFDFSTLVTLAPSRIFMPCFSNCFLAKRRDLGILDRHHLRHDLDDGDVDAHRPVERGKLDADGA